MSTPRLPTTLQSPGWNGPRSNVGRALVRRSAADARAARRQRRSAGFTLTELIVAIVGGLFVSMAVFALARDGTRFYRREAKIADATLGVLTGFQRLRNDISRAGFLGTPNIQADTRLNDCLRPATPSGLANLSSIAIRVGGSPGSPTLTGNNLTPDAISLAGSFNNVELFEATYFDTVGGATKAFLDPNGAALRRIGFRTLSNADRTTRLQEAFPAGRLLRIRNQQGKLIFAVIAAVEAAPPAVVLASIPLVPIIGNGGLAACAVGKSPGTGGVVNTVNLVRYEVKPITAAMTARYGGLVGATSTNVGVAVGEDATQRTELIREELDPSGAVIAGTEEVIAEYAVDLKFGATVLTSFINGNQPNQIDTFPEGNPAVLAWAQAPLAGGSPQRVKALRARLSVRSREPDREEGLGDVTNYPGVAPGLYRVALGSNGTAAPFARVRTLQADVFLNEHAELSW